MRKEEIYLDLSKLTEQEIEDIYKTLIDNNESIYEETIDNLNNGVFDRHYNALICDENEWVESVDNIHRKEITLQQFKDLFKPQQIYEIGQGQEIEIEMRKEEIYLDLSKLTEQEIKDILFILENNNEPIFEKALEDLIQGNKDSFFSNLHFNIEEKTWLRCSSDAGKNQISLQQFKDLFKSYEISQEIEMKKEEIYLDLSKLSREEIKEAYKYLIENNQELLFTFVGCVSNGNHFKSEKYLVFCRPSSCSWTCAKDFDDRKEITLQQFKDLFIFKGVTSQDVRNAEEELFKDLTIGQEIEVNGYVLKVEREVSQWYVNKDTMKFIKSNYQPYGAILVTDKDFINQLEKFSK